MSKLQITGVVLLSIIALVVLLFFFGALDLSFTKWYAPKKENIRREVFEETKSYVHGKQQMLGKLYGEWQDAAYDEREAIEATIKMQIADIEADDISNETLREFLIQVRGY